MTVQSKQIFKYTMRKNLMPLSHKNLKELKNIHQVKISKLKEMDMKGSTTTTKRMSLMSEGKFVGEREQLIFEVN